MPAWWPTHLEFWHWWIAAVTLCALEMLVPGVFLLWLGAAAALTGIVAYLLPATDWQIELMIFAALSIAIVTGVRLYQRRHPVISADSDLNQRAARYVGHVYMVEETFNNGRGKLRIGDTVWVAEGPDLVAGAKAQVVGAEGAVLKVIAPRAPS